jgi:hypothetical protein
MENTPPSMIKVREPCVKPKHFEISSREALMNRDAFDSGQWV